MAIQFDPIGVIHTPHKHSDGTPIQVGYAEQVEGEVEVFPEYQEGLNGVEKFSRIWLLYHFHCASQCRLTVKPFLDNHTHGLFATRAPARPNPIGVSAVELIEIKGNIIHVKGVDMLDGSPLLDIKPYISQFDHFATGKEGWFENRSKQTAEADSRFEQK
ncbi:tRNA (N6-threonylcarbamoyladenosine(37)-N6)-methyltransferase TrmO [bacterium]|nr:tRNA (N6-threonylcarbamoyladenosine(37)-N6)-methyltransferase TrmO [bacterium]